MTTEKSQFADKGYEMDFFFLAPISENKPLCLTGKWFLRV